MMDAFFGFTDSLAIEAQRLFPFPRGTFQHSGSRLTKSWISFSPTLTLIHYFSASPFTLTLEWPDSVSVMTSIPLSPAPNGGSLSFSDGVVVVVSSGPISRRMDPVAAWDSACMAKECAFDGSAEPWILALHHAAEHPEALQSPLQKVRSLTGLGLLWDEKSGVWDALVSPPKLTDPETALWYSWAVYQWLHAPLNEGETQEHRLEDLFSSPIWGHLEHLTRHIMRGNSRVQMRPNGLLWETEHNGARVDLNALWYSHLHFYKDLLVARHEEHRFLFHLNQLNHVFFKSFWLSKSQHLCAVHRPEKRDTSCSLNQLVAAAMPYSHLTHPQIVSVLKAIDKQIHRAKDLAFDPQYLGLWLDAMQKVSATTAIQTHMTPFLADLQASLEAGSPLPALTACEVIRALHNRPVS
ncbi:MAG: amylo-alpha-1,6-glucosidase [Candidatus Margulisiibacteriota bacterium]